MGTPAGRGPAPSDPPDFVLGDLGLGAPSSVPESPPEAPDVPRRRRHPAVAVPETPRPAFLRGTDAVLRWGPPLLLAFAPLAWGSVEIWSETLVVTGAAAIGAVWLLRLALFPERCAAERVVGSHAGSWSAGLHRPLIALAAVGLLQLVPLGSLVEFLSPVGAAIQRRAGVDTGALTLSLAGQGTLRSLAQIAGFTLLFFAVLDGIHGRVEVRRLALTLLVLGFAHAVGGILWHFQAAGRAYWLPNVSGSSFGPYVNRNHFASLMGMAIPLGVGWMLGVDQRRRATGVRPGAAAKVAGSPHGAGRGSRRFLFGFMVAVMAGALGLSLSRGGIVSTLAALSALAVGVGARQATRKHFWKTAAAVFGALAFTVWLAAGPLLPRLATLADLFGSSAESAPRTGIWADSLRMAVDFPLFGTGFGTFAEVFPGYQSVHAGLRVTEAHNDWLQLFVEGGLAGVLVVLVLIASFLAVAIRPLGRRHDREVIFLAMGGLGGLLAFLLHACVEFNTHIPANALWFTVLAALTLKTLSSKMGSGQ